MGHLKHIRLQTYKGLNSATLLDLSKINVLCGPNNSGKTTVLECIANPKLFVAGINVPIETSLPIAKAGLRGKSWGDHNKHLDNQYIEKVSQALTHRPVWFSDEYENLVSSIDWHFAEPWGNPKANLTSAYRNAFPKLPKIALIPAKRKMETSKGVNAHETIQTDGSGILNFLFMAKNQAETSVERKNFEAICSAFLEISAGFEFQVYFQAVNINSSPAPTLVELRFRKAGGTWIQAVDCGLGLHELLITLYFALASDHEVVLIEEPENHLHPEIQRRLIDFLRKKTQKQFFLSTHSSVFLNTQFADRVFTCRMTNEVKVENATNRASALTELGYSIADNLVSDLVVLCEGPSDKPVLEEFFLKLDLYKRGNIKVWPLGGDIMDQLDLSVFQESHQLIALIDGDPGSSVIRKRFQKNCDDAKIPVTRLQRYSLENYFSLAAIGSVMKGQMPTGIEKLDPDKAVEDQLGFGVKKNGGKIAKVMSLDDVKDSDFAEFLHKVGLLLTTANPSGSKS